MREKSIQEQLDETMLELKKGIGAQQFVPETTRFVNNNPQLAPGIKSAQADVHAIRSGVAPAPAAVASPKPMRPPTVKSEKVISPNPDSIHDEYYGEPTPESIERKVNHEQAKIDPSGIPPVKKSIEEQLEDVLRELKKGNAPGAGLPPMGMESADPMGADPMLQEAAMEGEAPAEEMMEQEGGNEVAEMVKELTEILGLTPEQVAKLEMLLEEMQGQQEQMPPEMPAEAPMEPPMEPQAGGSPLDEQMMKAAQPLDEDEKKFVAQAPAHVISAILDAANKGTNDVNPDNEAFPMIEGMAERRNKELGITKSIEQQLEEVLAELKKQGPMGDMSIGQVQGQPIQENAGKMLAAQQQTNQPMGVSAPKNPAQKVANPKSRAKEVAKILVNQAIDAEVAEKTTPEDAQMGAGLPQGIGAEIPKGGAELPQVGANDPTAQKDPLGIR